MQLVERGKLKLDRDVNSYLDFTIPPKFGQPITLRHLLTHTAGFEEDRLAGEIGRALRRPASAIETGPLELSTADGRSLSLGSFARSTGGA